MAVWLALSAVAWSAAASTPPALAPHPLRELRRSRSNAPGLYAQYDWPKPTPASSTDMEVDHTWITIPTGTDADGNGVFASSQFWYDAYDTPCPAKSAHGMSCNSAGYMGSQVMKGSGGAEKVVFVFSCWDADSSHMVGWTTPKTCGRFGGEGTGSHCILEYPVKVGVKYNFRVAFSGQNQTGAFWSGTVTDSVTKAQTKVGTLFYPHLPNRTGFGNFKVQSDDFLEYFLGGDCDGAVTTAVGITGPYFHKRTVTATQAYPAYGGPGCNRSVVKPCIPGHGCGKPNVLLSGGKGVVRTVPDKKPLWKNETERAR